MRFVRSSDVIPQSFDNYLAAKDTLSGKMVRTGQHRDQSPEPNLRISAFICGSFLCFLAFPRLFSLLFYLCAFASLADVAKGGDGAKSALREIFFPTPRAQQT